MDDLTLTHRFHTAFADEPPLLLDPDDLVTKAGIRHRRRRAGLAATLGVLAVAMVMAGAQLLTGTGAPAAGRSPDVLWPPQGVRPPPPFVNGKLLSDQLNDRFEAAIPKVVPGRPFLKKVHGTYGEFVAPPFGPVRGVEVGERVDDYTVYLAVRALAEPIEPASLHRLCTLRDEDLGWKSECDYTTLADGAVLMTQTSNRPSSAPHHIMSVTHFRPDGTYVYVTTDFPAEVDAPPPLTREQLVSLAIDPAFNLSER